MPDFLLAVEYGGYISVVKLALFLILFYLWIPLVSWVHEDSKAVETNSLLWTVAILASAMMSTILWFVMPVFAIGIIIFIIFVGLTSLLYVFHRNALVVEFNKVLTVNHIKGLFQSKKTKENIAYKTMVFITANKNEIEMPEPKTMEFVGYKMATDLFTDAERRRTSQILISPSQADYTVAYQVDGVAIKQPSLEREQTKYLMNFLKHLADLDVKEKRKPQKGKFQVRRENNLTDWEIITAGSTAGEQMQLKPLTADTSMRLSEIGLNQNQIDQFEELATKKRGVFIVSGPPKSGVTTTFYALLRNHDAFLNSICTLEKDISGPLPNITQTPFSLSDTGTKTFGVRLRSIIRMAPDIVGASGCDDKESATIACQAAKENVLIYVTLPAENAVQALSKWIQLVGDTDLAVDTLTGISNQRLLRKLCDKCKQAYAPNPETLKKFNLPADKAKVFYRAGKVVYDKNGKEYPCENCQEIGFIGRTGVFETIMFNDELKASIKEAKTIQDMSKKLRSAKMLYLQEQALRKILAGVTCVNEMIRVFTPQQSAKPKKPTT